MATGYAYRVFGTPTDAKKWTFSAWIKKSRKQSVHIFGGGQSNQTGGGHSYLGLISEFYGTYYDGSSSQWAVISNAKHRDVSGWYHYMFVYDSAQATASNRIKGYINGEQITSFDTASYPSQNYSTMWNNNGITHYIGRRGQSQDFEGSLSHIHFCDGYAYSASDFGETDATTGEWKIKVDPSVSYGNNGFWLFKNDASMTDQSGNGNNFTLSGSITKTEDNPSNVFATFNPLNSTGNGTEPTYSIGNLQSVSPSSGGGFVGSSTLGVSSGKYYFEIQRSAGTSSNVYIGIGDEKQTREIARQSASAVFIGNAVYYKPDDGNKVVVTNGNGVESSYGNTYGNGDIIGIALNMDDNEITFYKNGTAQNSGTAISIPTPDGACFLNVINGSDTADTFQVNFGNGYFGTTAVSSAGTNASNNGIFEYNVPSGYTALSTKGLNL